MRYVRAASAMFPLPGCSFLDLQPFDTGLSLAYLDIDLGNRTWALYRLWAAARLTGNWPVYSVRGFSFFIKLPMCPLCGSPDIDLSHCLRACPGTECFNSKLHTMPGRCRTSDPAALLLSVFGQASSKEVRACQVDYVCACIEAVTLHPGLLTGHEGMNIRLISEKNEKVEKWLCV